MKHPRELKDFIRSRGPVLGFQSQALYTEVRQRWPISFVQFSNLGRELKLSANHVPPPTPYEPPTIEGVSAKEQRRMQAEAERRLLHGLRSQKALTDALVERMLEAHAVVPRVEIPVLSAPDRSSRDQTAFLMLSDLHIGNRVDSEETGGLGEYNYAIFQRRLARLSDAVRSITDHHRQSHGVPRLVMPWLGDMIEGDSIFPSQGELIDKYLPEQIELAIVDLTQFVLGLLDTFQHIFIPVVTGNHGRLGKKGQHKRWINWDYFVGRMVRHALRDYADRIEFEVPKAAFAVVDVEGYSFLLRHGDGIKSWGGIPYYGIARSTGRWVAIQAKNDQHFDYMCLGHFHASTSLPFTGVEVLINGAFPGPTEYNVEVIETLADPMQLFGMVHPKYGLGARYPILLDPQPRA